MDVGESVWRSGLVGSIKLGTQCRVKRKWENHFSRANKLVRVLHGDAPLEVVSEVVDGPELRRARIRQADVSLGVLADGHKDITRSRREPDPVGCLQSPGLAAQEFPLAAFQVQPIESQTVGMRIGADKDVSGIVSVEVAFNVTNHFVRAVRACDLQVVTRILAGGAEFSQVPLDSIAERDRAKRRGSAASGVGGTENVLKIHESAGREIRAANAE